MAVRLGRTWSKLDADWEEKGKEKDLLCFVLASKVLYLGEERMICTVFHE